MTESNTSKHEGLPCPVCRVDLVMSDRQGIEIDLRSIDGELPLERGYYDAATRRIDLALRDRVLPGVTQR